MLCPVREDDSSTNTEQQNLVDPLLFAMPGASMSRMIVHVFAVTLFQLCSSRCIALFQGSRTREREV